ncbi:hypothetical protein GT354_37600 [Streptomyces sp. SID3343]|nr:hypothetical protein [Streptomyces sp. SID3343]
MRREEVSAVVAQIFGGEQREWQTTGADRFEVMTGTSKVKILLAGPCAVAIDMRRWSRGSLVHHCDGEWFLSPESRKGDLCGCPHSIVERKARVKRGLGPQPNVDLSFRLVDAPDLGVFRMKSISWKFAENASVLKDAIGSALGESVCGLELEAVELKGGTRYVKPVLRSLVGYPADVERNPARPGALPGGLGHRH